MYNHLLLTIISFTSIWIGTGIAIKSVEKISTKLKISSFAISFLVLGFFTSISEFSVGINSVINNEPDIFIGNLIGASIVLFLMIIPLLAITGKNIKVPNSLQGINLILPMIVVSLPVVLIMDKQLTKYDGFIAITMYLILSINLQLKKGILEKAKSVFTINNVNIFKEIFKIVFGIGLIFLASHFIVEQTKYFSIVLNIDPFVLSILLISIGTNIPELSFVFRSLNMKNNQVAFGDYIGSASFNTFLFGILTIIYGKTINIENNYINSTTFLLIGVILFYIFAKSKNTISRFEGILLLLGYILFITTEFLLIK